MKNTITPTGAKALKQILNSTTITESQLEMLNGFIDLMTGPAAFDCMKSMAETIKKHKEELIVEKEASENLINELEKINEMLSNKVKKSDGIHKDLSYEISDQAKSILKLEEEIARLKKFNGVDGDKKVWVKLEDKCCENCVAENISDIHCVQCGDEFGLFVRKTCSNCYKNNTVNCDFENCQELNMKFWEPK